MYCFGVKNKKNQFVVPMLYLNKKSQDINLDFPYYTCSENGI